MLISKDRVCHNQCAPAACCLKASSFSTRAYSPACQCDWILGWRIPIAVSAVILSGRETPCRHRQTRATMPCELGSSYIPTDAVTVSHACGAERFGFCWASVRTVGFSRWIFAIRKARWIESTMNEYRGAACLRNVKSVPTGCRSAQLPAHIAHQNQHAKDIVHASACCARCSATLDNSRALGQVLRTSFPTLRICAHRTSTLKNQVATLSDGSLTVVQLFGRRCHSFAACWEDCL